jgi:hypothetical protein
MVSVRKVVFLGWILFLYLDSPPALGLGVKEEAAEMYRIHLHSSCISSPEKFSASLQSNHPRE